MDKQELKQILATKAPAYQRSLIEIPKDSFVTWHSSLTDYLDSVLGDSPKMQNRIDHLVMRYRLGATDEVKGEHYGTVLPRINRKGMIVGGNVLHFNVDDGSILNNDALVNHLYSWYAFDYYVDPNVFLVNTCCMADRLSLSKKRRLPCLARWLILISNGWQ